MRLELKDVQGPDHHYHHHYHLPPSLSPPSPSLSPHHHQNHKKHVLEPRIMPSTFHALFYFFLTIYEANTIIFIDEKNASPIRVNLGCQARGSLLDHAKSSPLLSVISSMEFRLFCPE